MNAPKLTPATAREIRDLAAAIDHAEAKIKRVLLTATRAQDCGTIIKVLNRWQNRPVTEVLTGIAPDASSRRARTTRRTGGGVT